LPAADREADVQRVAGEDRADDHIARRAGGPGRVEAEHDEQERSGEHPEVGLKDRRDRLDARAKRRVRLRRRDQVVIGEPERDPDCGEADHRAQRGRRGAWHAAGTARRHAGCVQDGRRRL
jgi:hypothetical protein